MDLLIGVLRERAWKPSGISFVTAVEVSERSRKMHYRDHTMVVTRLARLMEAIGFTLETIRLQDESGEVSPPGGATRDRGE